MVKRQIKTPYDHLLSEYHEYAVKVDNPRKRIMWTYGRSRLGETWNLTLLAERVAAAAQLGYDVCLEMRDGDLGVFYVKKRPAWPARFCIATLTERR